MHEPALPDGAEAPKGLGRVGLIAGIAAVVVVAAGIAVRLGDASDARQIVAGAAVPTVQVVMPAAICCRPVMMVWRALSEKARVVSSSLTSSGMMLRLVPPWMSPTVTTEGSRGSSSRLTMVWIWVMKRAARVTGSRPRSGREPWPPMPRMVTSMEVEPVCAGPLVMPTVPAGCSLVSCSAAATRGAPWPCCATTHRASHPRPRPNSGVRLQIRQQRPRILPPQHPGHPSSGAHPHRNQWPFRLTNIPGRTVGHRHRHAVPGPFRRH